MQHKIHDAQKNSLGFWIYLMSDCMLFATLFAAFAVLRNNTFGDVSLGSLVNGGYVLTQTILLLFSSYTTSVAVSNIVTGSLKKVIFWLSATMALGISFLVMEINEFTQLVHEGHGWQANAAMSSFFTLVGTHGLHIAVGLIWAGTLVWLANRRGLAKVENKLKLFSMYWHFLDVVWICIFTVVYLRGLMS